MSIVQLQDVESSQIAAIGHDPINSVLAIRFKDWGGNPSSLYHYQNVSVAEFEAFRDAESISRHFGQHIKPFADRYPFERIEDRPGVPVRPRAA